MGAWLSTKPTVLPYLEPLTSVKDGEAKAKIRLLRGFKSGHFVELSTKPNNNKSICLGSATVASDTQFVLRVPFQSSILRRPPNTVIADARADGEVKMDVQVAVYTDNNKTTLIDTFDRTLVYLYRARSEDDKEEEEEKRIELNESVRVSWTLTNDELIKLKLDIDTAERVEEIFGYLNAIGQPIKNKSAFTRPYDTLKTTTAHLAKLKTRQEIMDLCIFDDFEQMEKAFAQLDVPLPE